MDQRRHPTGTIFEMNSVAADTVRRAVGAQVADWPSALTALVPAAPGQQAALQEFLARGSLGTV
jgi:hypothetical protein